MTSSKITALQEEINNQKYYESRIETIRNIPLKNMRKELYDELAYCEKSLNTWKLEKLEAELKGRQEERQDIIEKIKIYWQKKQSTNTEEKVVMNQELRSMGVDTSMKVKKMSYIIFNEESLNDLIKELSEDFR